MSILEQKKSELRSFRRYAIPAAAVFALLNMMLAVNFLIGSQIFPDTIRAGLLPATALSYVVFVPVMLRQNALMTAIKELEEGSGR